MRIYEEDNDMKVLLTADVKGTGKKAKWWKLPTGMAETFF